MSIETVAARLTEAVYPVALRYATVGSWVDLELELWKVLTETLQRMGTDGFELPQRKPTLEADVVNGNFFSSDKTFRGKQPSYPPQQSAVFCADYRHQRVETATGFQADGS